MEVLDAFPIMSAFGCQLASGSIVPLPFFTFLSMQKSLKFFHIRSYTVDLLPFTLDHRTGRSAFSLRDTAREIMDWFSVT